MRAAAVLAGLYPPAVRERWGADISDQVAASGVRSWPDTLVGAVRLWLHPSDWPETLDGQTRRVLTVALFALLAATTLLLRSVEPSAALTADVHHPATSLWLAPLLLGVVLAAPLPPLRGEALALRRLAGAAVRTLAAPVAAGLVMCLTAWSGVAVGVTGFGDAGLRVYYWATLGFVAYRGCVLVAVTARTAVLPSARRLSAALLCVGGGLALAAGQDVIAIAGTTPGPGSLGQALALALLAAAALSTGRDLRRESA